jgi:deoxyribonuclease-1
LKIVIAILFVIFSTQSFALSSYYDSETHEELSRGELRDQDLKRFIGKASNRNFRPLGYKAGMKKILFGQVHLEKDSKGYFVRDLYCDFIIRDSVGPGKIPENGTMNVEHTWPQSKGANKEPARGDMHHLFPTDSRANSTRGNFIFAEVNNGKDARDNCSLSQSGKARNPSSNGSSREQAFEPAMGHRGNVARAMFYMATKYSWRISATEEFYLKKWHKEDPVDSEEIRRNDLVQGAQGNRNPFIDYPELVDRIEDF